MKKIWLAFICALFVSACGDEFNNRNGGPAATCGIVAACAANAHCDGNTCVCNAGLVPVNGVCTAVADAGSSACGLVAACATNSHCDSSNRCVCNEGFSEINGACVAGACGSVASCVANAHCDNSSCVCNTGYTMTNGACVPVACGLVAQCAVNAHCDNNPCTCDSGFVQMSGVCTRVDGGAVGPGCVGSSCARATRLRVTVTNSALMSSGWTIPTLWTTQAVMTQGSNGSLTYSIQGTDNGYLWITVRRSLSSSEEVAPNVCQTAVDFGLKIELEQSGIWVDRSALIPAERDTDANNGRRKFRAWIIDGERASYLAQHPCQ